MTTTVTLKTHGWPVDVDIVDSYGRIYHSETITIEPNAERDFHITSTRSIKFTELPFPQEPMIDTRVAGAD